MGGARILTVFVVVASCLGVSVLSAPLAVAPPKLFALDPDVGAAGTLVGMAGAGFLNVSAAGCQFGQVNVSFQFYTGQRRVYCTAPQQPTARAIGAGVAAADGRGGGKPMRVQVRCTNDGVAFTSPQPFTYLHAGEERRP